MAAKGQYKDYTGQRFGKLVALERVGLHHDGKSLWKWQCDCGNIIERTTPHIVHGDTKSCGCHRAKVSTNILTQYRKENNGKPKKNILGLKFNKLIAIEYIGEENNRRAIWLWQCECGNQIKLQSDVVKNGHTKSCGCLNKDKELELYGQNFDYSFTLAARKECYNSYKQRARRSNIHFELSFDECMYFFEKSCFYCGREPSNIKKARSTESTFIYNGIDRVNNDRKAGYRLENIISCCARCNRAKGTMDFNEYLEFLTTSVNYIKQVPLKQNPTILKLVA